MCRRMRQAAGLSARGEHRNHRGAKPGNACDLVQSYFTVSGKYQTVADLPKPSEQIFVATAQHLRLAEVPQEYPGKLIRVDLHRWTDAGWSESPEAIVDGVANPKNGQFQGVVFAVLLRSAGFGPGKSKPGGSFRVAAIWPVFTLTFTTMLPRTGIIKWEPVTSSAKSSSTAPGCTGCSQNPPLGPSFARIRFRSRW